MEELRNLIREVKEGVEKGLFVLEEEETFYRLKKKSNAVRLGVFYQFCKKYPEASKFIKTRGTSIHIDKKLYDDIP